MELVLGVCTILGGAAALWFFWDRITGKTGKHGATVEDALSRSGSITADDQTGQGASVKRADAKKDITASSRTAEGTSSPKETPPRP